MASATFTAAGCAPVILAGTTLAVADLRLDPAIRRDVFRGGGGRFGAALLKLGRQPVITFKTPFKGAYDLLGLSTTKVTAFVAHLAKYVDYQRAAGTVHRKWSLASGAAAAAYIASASCEQGGILWAEVVVIPLSSDGMADPLVAADTASLPALSAPALHTLGPLSVGGSRINGLRTHAYDSGIQLSAEASDGDIFLRNAIEIAASPTLGGTHHDPIGLLTSLGLGGATIGAQAAVAAFRDVDANGAALSTGLTLSVAAGSVDPGPVSVSVLRPAELGVSVQPITTNDTHPVAATFAAAIAA